MRPLAPLCLVLLGCLPKPAEPVLRAVEPAFFDADAGTPLVLITEGVLPPATLDFDRPDGSSMPVVVVSAFVDDGTNRVDVLDAQWVDSTRVTGRLAGPVSAGVYDVHLIEPRGRELVLPQALQALDCSEGDCPLPDGGVPDSGVVVCPTLNFRDRDLDGYGSGVAQAFCGPGWVPLSGDCDDRDSLTSPGALELCNGFDDDCDGQVDEGRCTVSTWTADDALRPFNDDLLSCVSYAPGSLWIAAGDKAYVRRGGPDFVDATSGCPGNLRTVWAEPDGAAEVGGGSAGSGRLAQQLPSANACSDQRTIPEPPVAMVGFPAGDDFDFVAVLADGRLLRWQRGGTPMVSPSNLPSSAVVTDLHGVTKGQLYAVGSAVLGGSRRQRVWALQTDGSWKDEPLPGQGAVTGSLRGVWALSAVDVIVVGEDGKIFRRSTSGWRSIDSDTSADLTSVRAFSAGRFYVTSSEGTIRRRARGDWTTVFRNDAGVPFNDLSATSEEDLWAVGDRGVIGRGPH